MRLTTRDKLVAGFGLVLLLLMGIAFFMLGEFSKSNERLSEIVDVAARRINLSNEIMIGVLETARNEKNIILEKDAAQKEKYKDRLYPILELVDQKTAELEGLSSEEGKVSITAFKATWSDYQADLQDIMSLAMANRSEEAFDISISQGFQAREAAIGQMKQIIDKNQKSVDEERATNERSYGQARNLIIVLVLLGIVMAFLTSFWIIQSIGRRISGIAAQASRIASREFSDDLLTDKTNDELTPVSWSLQSIKDSFREVTVHANAVASGDLDIDMVPRSDKDILGNALMKMTRSLRETTAANKSHIWLASGQNQLNESLRGDQSVEELCDNTIRFLCNFLDAQIGALYLLDNKEGSLELAAGYAFAPGIDIKDKFHLQEGLIGQVAQEQKQILLTRVEEGHIRITSGVLDTRPKHLLVTPFLFEERTLGVAELGKLGDFTALETEFVNLSMKDIAIAINSAISRKKIRELLDETQAQSHELQNQQEQLVQMNEELEEQTQNLKQQQEKLQMINEELEQQTQSLEVKNAEVMSAKHELEQKSVQLELNSKYKSEFLANMSHELRTPLNSMLILSKNLGDNKLENLTMEQVENAQVIHKSGRDLLVLIDDILDLSKIEAGKMSVNIERVMLRQFADALIRVFKPLAEQKQLKLILELDKDAPESIRTDAQRLNQVIKNLLSNAIKFTHRGSVTLQIRKHAEKTLGISVKDTGIGLPEAKQASIFEAFQQADGSTSRKYGGTGLGLYISRELARLLGGEITLESKENEGSAFSLIIPFDSNEMDRVQGAAQENGSEGGPVSHLEVSDDRNNIDKKDRVLLVIEEDMKFASSVLKQARAKGFKCLFANTGEYGLTLAAEYVPHAIILNLSLPDISGHSVLTALKANPALRHIPVHVLAANEHPIDSLRFGAITALVKPLDKNQLDKVLNQMDHFISKKMKTLMVVEDDASSMKAISTLIGNGDVKCLPATTGGEALSLFKENDIDCIILDLGLPDISGFDLITELKNTGRFLPPIIVYTARDLSREENEELQKHSESIIIKGVKSEERLLDETALFLHRSISKLPEPKRHIINKLYTTEAVFEGKSILLVDDDMRNVFALSRVLKENHLDVIKAENGKAALEALDKNPLIDIVLMDIMMPEMDGYEAMSRIRAQERFKNLPIIALTAKAMKDDRQKCMDAGASDYVSKPVDTDRLLSLIRMWLIK